MIAPPLWTDMHESEMKLKIRVRRIKEGRDLRGGFAAFTSCFPDLCESKQASILPLSLSQPCLPVTNVGLTRILPHLYLGSQKDVLNKDLMAQNGITYVLNASNTCPKPDFISENHFLRVPVNDSYCEKLLPWLEKTNEFIDKAKVSNCRVIVHCLAGISRSATIAIAYIMKTMGLSSDDAYRFVKDRRPSISPNFNFLGQLLEFERELKRKTSIPCSPLRSTPDHLAEDAKVIVEQSMENSRPYQRTQETTVVKTKPPKCLDPHKSPTSLQKDLSSLNLSTDQILHSNRLKCSFSLDIKSVYSSNQHSISQSDSESMPKLFKLDSPKSTNMCRHESSQDGPSLVGSWCGGSSPVVIEPKLSHQVERHEGGRGYHERISAMTLSLNLNQSQQSQVICEPRNLANRKASSFLSLPLDNSGIWTKHRSTTQATTPVTPTEDHPWFCAGSDPNIPSVLSSSSAMRFGGTSAYAALSSTSSSSVQMSWDKPQVIQEVQFKRRSCQMEFDEILSTARGTEEFGKLGKQSSFSGSMEVIKVS